MIATKLFVELNWLQALGVIAGGVLVGKLSFAFLAEVFTPRNDRGPRPKPEPSGPSSPRESVQPEQAHSPR